MSFPFPSPLGPFQNRSRYLTFKKTYYAVSIILLWISLVKHLYTWVRKTDGK